MIGTTQKEKKLAAGKIKELVVRGSCSGMTVFHFLRKALPRSMSRDIVGLIDDGLVSKNGKPAVFEAVVRSGDFVTVDTTALLQRETKSDAPRELEILYRDEAVLCVDKPAGVPVIPDRRHRTETAVEICRRMLGDGPYSPKPVHRIDKFTSGVLMLALKKEFVQPLGELFAERRVSKVYLAFVRGVVRTGENVIDAPIGPDARRASRMVVYPPKKGKTAVTRIETLQSWRDYSLVAAMPETGRTHQIRVHLSHIKHPILCDSLYGGGDVFHLSTIKPDYHVGRGKRERPLLKRQALHAAELKFESPDTGRLVHVKAPLPDDLDILRKKLDKFS